MAYTYRFINSSNEIIYVGYTGQRLDTRIMQHFEKGHLSKKCYSEIARIEYIQYKTKADAQIMEVYYINKYKPKYNKLNKQTDVMNLQLEEKEWKLYRQIKPIHESKVKNTGIWRFVAVIYFLYMLYYILLK